LGWPDIEEEHASGICMPFWASRFLVDVADLQTSLEQGVKLLGLLLTGSTGQHMAGRNGLA
jgi:hypothetical protein